MAIPQFQKKGAVPNLALTVGTLRISWALLTSGRFLEKNYSCLYFEELSLIKTR